MVRLLPLSVTVAIVAPPKVTGKKIASAVAPESTVTFPKSAMLLPSRRNCCSEIR